MAFDLTGALTEGTPKEVIDYLVANPEKIPNFDIRGAAKAGSPDEIIGYLQQHPDRWSPPPPPQPSVPAFLPPQLTGPQLEKTTQVSGLPRVRPEDLRSLQPILEHPLMQRAIAANAPPAPAEPLLDPYATGVMDYLNQPRANLPNEGFFGNFARSALRVPPGLLGFAKDVTMLPGEEVKYFKEWVKDAMTADSERPTVTPSGPMTLPSGRVVQMAGPPLISPDYGDVISPSAKMVKGLVDFTAEPLGLYGWQKMKSRWDEDPVGAGMGLLPLLGFIMKLSGGKPGPLIDKAAKDPAVMEKLFDEVKAGRSPRPAEGRETLREPTSEVGLPASLEPTPPPVAGAAPKAVPVGDMTGFRVVPTADVATGKITDHWIDAAPDRATALKGAQKIRERKIESGIPSEILEIDTKSVQDAGVVKRGPDPYGTGAEWMSIDEKGPPLPQSSVKGIVNLKTGATEPLTVAPKTERSVPSQPNIAPDTQSAMIPLAEFPIERMNPRDLVLEPEVFQYKAAGARGIQAPLKGRYNELAAGNILVYERLNGKRVVLNGHHRVDLALKKSIAEVNVQIIKEADGYTVQDAIKIGAETNILEGKGTIYDNAKYARNADEKSAKTFGEKGIAGQGYNIGRFASDDTYGQFVNRKISPDTAEAISVAAPGNPSLQAIGLKYALANKHAAADEIGGYVRDIGHSATLAGATPGAKQTDMFRTAAFIKTAEGAERGAKIKTSRVEELSEMINSGRGAAKNPEEAARLGIDVKDLAGTRNKIAALKQLRDRWKGDWFTDPELMANVNEQLLKENRGDLIRRMDVRQQPLRGDIPRAEPPRGGGLAAGGPPTMKEPVTIPGLPSKGPGIQPITTRQPGLPKYATGSSINLDRLMDSAKGENVEQLKRDLNQMTDENRTYLQQDIEGAKAGKLTIEQMHEIAAKRGITIEELSQYKPGEIYDFAELTSARNLHVAILEKWKEAQNKYSESRTEIEREINGKKLEEILGFEKTVAFATSGAARAWGREGRMLSEFARPETTRNWFLTDKPAKEIVTEIRDAKLDKLTQGLFDLLRDQGLTDKIKAWIGETDMLDPNAFAKLLRKIAKEIGEKPPDIAKKKTVLDMIHEFWINGILTPVSQAANITSNIFNLLLKPALYLPVEITMQKIHGRLAGQTPEQARYYGEIPKEFVGILKALKPAIRAGLIEWKYEIGEAGGKIAETGSRGSIPSWTLRKGRENKLVKGVPIPLTGEVTLGGKQARIMTRGLSAGDIVFKTFIGNGAIAREAFRLAKSEGKIGKDLVERTTYLELNPTPQMMEMALREAKYYTYTSDLGAAGKKWNEARMATKGGRWIAPFFRTPLNVETGLMAMTPLNFPRLLYLLNKGEFHSLKVKGKPTFNRTEFYDQFSRPIAGTLLGATFVMLAAEGYITGAGPSDPIERERLKGLGWLPYAFRLPGFGYIPLRRIPPLGNIMGMAGDMYELSANASEEDNLKRAKRIAGSISNNWLDMPFITGVVKFLTSVLNPEKQGEGWLEQFIGSFVPSYVSTVKKIIDPVNRKPETIGEILKSKIPGLSESVKPRLTEFGEETEMPGTAFERGFSPFPFSPEKSDKLARELVGLRPGGESIHFGKPGKVFTTVEDDGREVLNRWTSEGYFKLIKEMGQLAREYVEAEINSSEYHDKTPEEKGQTLRDAYERARADAEAELRLDPTLFDVMLKK